jgi:hypothetical protein
LRRISGLKDDGTEGWKKLHIEEIHIGILLE